MATLRRTVRLILNPGDGGTGTQSLGVNGFGGKPAMRGLGRYYELEVACRGEPDPVSGYLINIKTIDQAVHGSAAEVIARACRERPGIEPAALIVEVAAALGERLASLASVRWHLTPSYSVELEVPMQTDDAAHTVLVRQRFDLAAAHRLHCSSMSEDENRTAFGRCNNPNGHGHNYRVEPCVRVRVSADGAAVSLDTIERLTHDHIVERFDHTHLNLDTPEFAPGGGVNPSVENIARVFFERLSPAICEAGGELVSMTVWETDRTSCCYPG